MVSSFGKWLCHKSRALLNGILLLRKRSPRTTVLLLPCDDTLEKVLFVNSKQVFTRYTLLTLTLGFPASWTMRNMKLLIKRYFVDGTKMQPLDLSLYSFSQSNLLCLQDEVGLPASSFKVSQMKILDQHLETLDPLLTFSVYYVASIIIIWWSILYTIVFHDNILDIDKCVCFLDLLQL